MLFFPIESSFPRQDWPSIPNGQGVSEKQRRELELLKIALQKHVAAGNDKLWSEADPIRAWASYCKHSMHALEMKQKFEQEIATLGSPP